MEITVLKKCKVYPKFLKVCIGGDWTDLYKDFNFGNKTYDSIGYFLNDHLEFCTTERGYKELTFTIDIDSGKVLHWPEKRSVDFYDMKIVDGGKYIILDGANEVICEHEGYVPECLGPGGYGDYFEFEINDQGYITDWDFRDKDYFEIAETSEEISNWCEENDIEL